MLGALYVVSRYGWIATAVLDVAVRSISDTKVRSALSQCSLPTELTLPSEVRSLLVLIFMLRDAADY